MVGPQPSAHRPSEPISSSSGAFIGRQRELGQLKAALADARSGQGRLVMLVGEPGIGKTRTAQELANYAKESGTQVLWGRCFQEEGAPPYWPWVQLLQALVQDRGPEQLSLELGPGATDIPEVVPEVREKLPHLERPPALEPEQARFRFFNSVTTALKNAAQIRPLVLILDNLHWADSSSLLLLEFLARRLGDSCILAIGTYRDAEVSRQHPLTDTLAQLAREPVFQRLALQGLSREDTGYFIEARAGISPTRGVTDAIYSHTEGNPFFTSEVLRLLHEQGRLAAANLPHIELPPGVREVIGQRLNRLSEECHQTLATAAIISRQFELRVLGRLSSGTSEERLLAIMDEALEARLIEELPRSAEGYQFTHALIQETLASELSAARRVRLHARIAEALEEMYGDAAEAHAAELAHHFAQAAPVLGPEKLVKYSLLAGEHATKVYAWEEAIDHYENTLELLEKAEGSLSDQADVLAKLALVTGSGRGRGDLGYWAKALLLYERVGDSKKAGTVHLRLGQRGGVDILDWQRRHSHSVKAVELLEPHGESPELAQAYVQLGDHAAHGHGLKSSAVPMMEKGLEMAEQLGDGAGVMQAARLLGHVLVYHTGDIQRGLQLYHRACEEARRMSNPLGLIAAAINLSREYAFLRDPETALTWAEQAIEASKEASTLQGQITSTLAVAWALILRGDAAGALSHLETARQVAGESGIELSQLTSEITFTVVPALVHVFLGDWQQAETELLQLLEFNKQINSATFRPFWVLPTLGWLYLEKGDLNGAKTCLQEAAATAQAGGDYPPELLANALLVQVGTQGSELGQAAGYLRRAQEVLSQGSGWRGLAAEVDLAEGMLATAEKHWPEAEAAFQRAVEINSQYHLPYYEAKTLLEWGHMCLSRGGPGDRDRSLNLLHQAFTIFETIQVPRMVERVVALQERAESQPARAPAYPAGLTHREVEVLRLVAAGKSSAEIAAELVLSRRTVERHISNLYTKTNCHNRSEVTAFAFTQGLMSST